MIEVQQNRQILEKTDQDHDRRPGDPSEENNDKQFHDPMGDAHYPYYRSFVVKAEKGIRKEFIKEVPGAGSGNSAA